MTYDWIPEAGDGPAPIDAVTFTRLTYGVSSVPDTAWWSAMIELDQTSIAEFQQAVAQDFPQDLLVPAAYDANDRAARPERQFVAIFARRALVDILNRHGNGYGVVNVHLGLVTPADWLNVDAEPQTVPVAEVAVDTVVTGMIDDGLGIAHELFRKGNGSTRVDYCAILPTPPDLRDVHTSQGRAWNARQIDSLLQALTWSGFLDEEQFYTETGQIDLGAGKFSPLSLQRSHGTHVMGLSTGYAPVADVTTRPIICAVLPPRVVEDTSGISLLPSLCLALQMLSKRASRFQSRGGRPVPFVLNFSYGNFSGPHDGTDEVSRLFEQFLAADPAQKRWMTLPAGNGNLARSHGVIAFAETDRSEIELSLRVLPDDMTASHVEFWMPYSKAKTPRDFVSITVTPPFGPESATVNAKKGQKQTLRDSKGQVVATLLYTCEPAPTARGVITLAIEPTASLSGDRALAPSGRWKITAKQRELSPDQKIEVWIRRDQTLPGYRPGGRQSYFDNGDYQRFGPFGRPLPVDPPDDICPVRRSGTLSGFADGSSPMVVAAYTEQSRQLSDYSAAGPLTETPMSPTPFREGPDAAAKADQSDVIWGVISAGSRCGSYVRLNGTSVAAPRVARLASEHIGNCEHSAREWLAHAVQEAPFELADKPAHTRMGQGGISIPVEWTVGPKQD
jgi:Subtilase family